MKRPGATDSRDPTVCLAVRATFTTTTLDTIGPDGSLYGCPGFTGEKAMSTGHIDGRVETWRERNRNRFDTLDPWKACGDCAYMPTCAGGCLTASFAQLGDVNTPTCHKPAFESAVIALAHQVASATQETVQ